MYQRKRYRFQNILLMLQLMFLLLLTAGFYSFICKSNSNTHTTCSSIKIQAFIDILLHPISLIIVFLVALGVIWWGRLFCSHVCALGSIQEGLSMIQNSGQRQRKRVPYYIDRRLMWLKYAVLVFTISLIVVGIVYLQNKLTLDNSIYLKTFSMMLLAMIFLILSTFLTERLFCRYFCAYGALMNVIQYLSKRLKLNRRLIARNMEVCNDCGACNKECPMNIEIKDVELVENPNCIQCRRCIDKCPQKGALGIGTRE